MAILSTIQSYLTPKPKYDFSTIECTQKAIKAECEKQGLSLPTQIAYVLATVHHETNKTFKPVEEAYYLPEPTRTKYLKKLRYWPYVGKGFVQITWKYNYEKYSKLLNVDMVKNPDLAMVPENALFILVHGFKNGGFTGKKLETYVNEHTTDFVNARRCINGTDKAQLIAKYAREYQLKILSKEI